MPRILALGVLACALLLTQTTAVAGVSKRDFDALSHVVELSGKGEYAAAIAAADELLAAPRSDDYVHAQAWWIKGDAWFGLDDIDASLEAFEQAIQTGGLPRPRVAETRLLMAQIAHNAGNHDAAWIQLTLHEALVGGVTPEALFIRASVHFSLEDYRYAHADMQRYLAEAEADGRPVSRAVWRFALTTATEVEDVEAIDRAWRVVEERWPSGEAVRHAVNAFVIIEDCERANRAADYYLANFPEFDAGHVAARAFLFCANADGLARAASVLIEADAESEFAQPLIRAIAADDADEIREIAGSGQPLSFHPELKRTPLTLAVRLGADRAAAALIEHGADVDRADASSDTPLIQAAARRNHRIAEALLRAGADAGIANRNDSSPILFAVGYGDKRMVELLIEHAPQILASQGEQALNNAALGGHDDIVLLLLDAGVTTKGDRDAQRWLLNPSWAREDWPLASSLLHKAAWGGNVSLVRELIERGAPLNVPGSTGMTPLMTAVQMQRWDAAEVLLDAGSSVTISYMDGDSLLCRLIEKGGPQLISRVLAAGADLNAGPLSGRPIGCALRAGSLDALDQLIEAGADIEQPVIAENATPLSVAVILLKPDFVRRLLDAGATATGPLQVMLDWSNADIERILVANGYRKTRRGRTRVWERSVAGEQQTFDYKVQRDGYDLPALVEIFRASKLPMEMWFSTARHWPKN